VNHKPHPLQVQRQEYNLWSGWTYTGGRRPGRRCGRTLAAGRQPGWGGRTLAGPDGVTWWMGGVHWRPSVGAVDAGGGHREDRRAAGDVSASRGVDAGDGRREGRPAVERSRVDTGAAGWMGRRQGRWGGGCGQRASGDVRASGGASRSADRSRADAGAAGGWVGEGACVALGFRSLWAKIFAGRAEIFAPLDILFRDRRSDSVDDI